MSSRKKQKRQKRAQEAARLRRLVHAYQKGEQPASGPEIGLSGDFNDDTHEQ